MSSAGWNRKSLWLVLIASLAFNAGVGATFGVLAYTKYVAPVDRPKPGPRGGGPGRLGSLDKLNLTSEQTAQTKAAREQMIERVHQIRRELRKENEALTDLMTAAEPDHKAITEQLGKITSMRERMGQMVVDHFLSIKQLLEPQQQEAFNETIRRAFCRGGHGRAGLGGPFGPHRGPGRGRKGPFHEGND